MEKTEEKEISPIEEKITKELSHSQNGEKAVVDEPTKAELEPVIKLPPPRKKIETRGRPKKKVIDPKLITGDTLLLLVDLLPRIISFVLRNFFKKELDFRDLMLDVDEKKDLKKLADKAAADIDVNVSPIYVFCVTVVIIFASKIDL